MSTAFTIGGRQIGAGHSPYVIAEIGVNHDGDLDRALSLVHDAHQAGADAIKLQRFDPDRLLARSARLASYQSKAGEADAHEMLARLALTAAQCERIVEMTHELGLHAIVTVFNDSLVGETSELGFDAWKTASPDIVHKPLIGALIRTSKPIICSTGASTIDEVARATGWLADGAEGFALLHCVSSYPTPMDHANLSGIAALTERFRCPAGYSDHTQSTLTGAIAVAAGACILEKHLTWDTVAQGPDHAASLTGEQLRVYIDLAHEAHRAMGDGAKAPIEIELDVRSVARQSIVAARAIDAGEVITERDITYKRPGVGFEPWRTSEVVGRRASRTIEPDHAFTDEDLR